MSGSQLSKFMTGLAKDPAQMSAFKADPHAAMTKANLPEKDMVAVLSKNSALISKQIGHAGTGAAADADVTVVVVVL